MTHFGRITSITILLVLALSAGVSRAFNETPLERLDRQMSKHVTLELKDTPLTDACDLLTSITGMNIIISPVVRNAKPVVTIKVQDMDAGTCLGWLARLTETYAEVTDGAIYITDKRSKKVEDEERTELMLLGAQAGVIVTLPPEGQALTDDDRKTIAMQILEKEAVKVQDFPGPSIGLDSLKGTTNIDK